MAITKVRNAAGEVVHDCELAGCSVSWDGFVLNPARFAAQHPDYADESGNSVKLSDGAPVLGRSDPGPEWDTSVEGEARPAER